MINVLLIAYYWPPSGGGGVHRWLKMSKYFPYDKMNLFVYTPENPEYPALDESLVNQVHEKINLIKHPITEPYSFYKKFTGKKKEEKVYSGFINDKKSWKQDLAVWIRSNFFIPDARFLWIKPSIKVLKNKIKENNIDIVISTGPPHSMHLIASGLKRSNPSLKWIADFRDPWTNIDFYKQLKLTKWADKKHHRLEKMVTENADKVVTIGWTMKEEFEVLGSRKDIEIITNGYDYEDFETKVKLKDTVNLMHLGSLNEDRNPAVLWKAISELAIDKSLPDTFSVDLVGNVDQSVNISIKELNLENLVNVKGFVNHSEAIRLMKSAHCLLLVINNSPNAAGILTGKAFEYLGAKKPIICIGPKQGDVKKLLSEFPFAEYIEYSDIDKCREAILKLVNGEEREIESDSMKYSRKELAMDYFKLIEKVHS